MEDSNKRLLSWYDQGLLCNCDETEHVFDEKGKLTIETFHDTYCEANLRIGEILYEINQTSVSFE